MSTYPRKPYNKMSEFPEHYKEKAKLWQVIIQTGTQQYGLEIWEVLTYLEVHWMDYQWDEYYDRPYAHKVHADFKVMQESKYKN
jgi:hypothetical protein